MSKERLRNTVLRGVESTRVAGGVETEVRARDWRGRGRVGGRERVRRELAGGPEVCHRGRFVKRKKGSQRTRIVKLIL